jgi:hypothetical protein
MVVAVLRHPGKQGLEVLGALRRKVILDLPDHCIPPLWLRWLPGPGSASAAGGFPRASPPVLTSSAAHGACFAGSWPSAPAAGIGLRPNSSAAFSPQTAETTWSGRAAASTRSSACCWLPNG